MVAGLSPGQCIGLDRIRGKDGNNRLRNLRRRGIGRLGRHAPAKRLGD